MNELYLIKSGDNGFVEETSAVISADSGEISINDSLYVESAGNIGIGSSNPANKLDVVGSASISSDLTVQGITFTNVGGNSPSAVNDIIKYDGNNWVVAASTTLPGGGGGSTNSDVPAGLITTLTQGDAIHEVDFGYDSNNDRIVYDNVPKIAASLEIDGAGEIIPHTVSGVSESGYYVVFSEELPTANYRMHTVFGGTDAFWETGVANLEYSERNVEITRNLYVGQNVGIGTTTANEALTIRKDGARMTVESVDYENVLIGRRGSTGADLDKGYIRMKAEGTNAVVLDTAGNSYFNGGSVGIGTTNPSMALHVLSGADNDNTILESSDTAVSLTLKDSTGAAKIESRNDFRFSNNAGVNEIMRIDSSGNVGIGNDNPTVKLSVMGDNADILLQQSDGTISAQMISDASGNGKMGVNNAAGNLICYFNSNGDSYIKNNNVGIGTSSPANKLHIQQGVLTSSSTNSNTSVTIEDASNTGIQFLSAGQTQLRFGDAANNGAGSIIYKHGDDQLILNTTDTIALQGGNVGIGLTNPGSFDSEANQLVVRGDGDHAGITIFAGTASGRGNIYFSDGIVGSQAYSGGITYDHGDDDLSFRTSGVEKMWIKANGNVGIGTTDPGTYKLQVFGTLKIYDTSFVGSSQITSDDRVKHNEQDIIGAIETLSKITPKKYIKTTEMYDADHDFELDKDGNPVDENGELVEHRIEAGIIAQQVLTVDELAFAVNPEDVDEDGKVTSPYSLDYNSLFTYAIAAIQEQQAMIEDLKSEIEQLKS